ncbi:MAG: hypothetical protein ACRDPA_02660, partial [Solirubrobacteraceae bacterium]
MADAKPQKISIGFEGGQTLGSRIQPDELTKLRQALDAPPPNGWYDLSAEDGTVALDLKRVVYV